MSPVRVLRLAAGGDGVAKLEDGRTVFIPRTAPGDLVELSALREHKRFARARVGRLVEPGPHRIEPRCPHYMRDECGGCQMQHLDLDAQRGARSGFVGDALRRLAHLEVPDPELVPADKAYDYRTKLTLAVSEDRRRIGLHRYDRAEQGITLKIVKLSEAKCEVDRFKCLIRSRQFDMGNSGRRWHTALGADLLRPPAPRDPVHPRDDVEESAPPSAGATFPAPAGPDRGS